MSVQLVPRVTWNPTAVDEPFEVISSDDLDGFKENEVSALVRIINYVVNRIFFRVPEQLKDEKGILIHVRDGVQVEETEEQDDKDLDFQNIMASDFLKNGKWNPFEIRRQIKKDLLRIYVTINDSRITSFSSLCDEIGLPDDFFNQNEIKDELLSSQQKQVLYFLSILHQGVVGEAMKLAHKDLADERLEQTMLSLFKDLTARNLKELHFSQPYVNGPVRDIALEIIKNSNSPLALESSKSLCQKHPDLRRYFASAIPMGILDEKFLPQWKLISNPIPVHPTQLKGTCKEKSPLIVIFEQDTQLTLVLPDDTRKHFPIHITGNIIIGRQAEINCTVNSEQPPTGKAQIDSCRKDVDDHKDDDS